MDPKITEWKTKDGLKVHCRIWEPDTAQSEIWIVHGMGDHGGRYETLAQTFAQSGYRVIIADHRGNGPSEGKRGFVTSFDDFLDDLSLTIDKIETGKKRFILGQSMGGLIVARYLMTRSQDFEKAVLMSPMLRTTNPPPRFKILLAKLVRKIYPSLTLRAGFNSGDLTADENRKAEYRKDHLKHDWVSAELGLAMFEQGLLAMAEAKSIKIPTLAKHGRIDKITCPAATEMFACENEKITLKIWEGMRHELHNEVESAKVISFVLDWLNS